VGDEVFRTFPGFMLCTPPGVTHSERALTAYSNYHVSIGAPEDTPWPRAVTDDAAGTLNYLCRALAVHHQKWGDGPGGEMIELILAQLDCFLRRAVSRLSPPPGEQMVLAAERIFEERFASALEIAVVARELRLAPSTLRAQFARQRGYPPAEGLQLVRRRSALTLLRSSDLSLEEIARATGYHSPSHLSRHVKAATGQSPGRWRKSAGANRVA